MTGRDLIIYILENRLEEELVLDNNKLLGFMTAEEAAIQYNVGVATIKLWYELKIISGVKVGEEIFIPFNHSITRRDDIK